MPRWTLSKDDRFWNKVDQSGGPNCCWPWLAASSPDGYGRFWVDGRLQLAHRVAYELGTGGHLDEMEVDHRCFNLRCCNPAHLRPVTSKWNKEHRRGANRNSKSGVLGVNPSRNGTRWVAQVKHHRKTFYLGTFDTVNEAEAAVITKRLELFTHNDLDRLRDTKITPQGAEAIARLIAKASAA